MSERDPVIAVLEELDRPVTPRPEFTDALRERLLVELAHPNGAPSTPRARRPRLPLPARRLWPAVGAIAVAALALAIATAVLTGPSTASALEVIHEARQAFAAAPPFQATLRVELNPKGSTLDVPKGATSRVLISYGGHRKFRTEIAAVEPPFATASAPGSYRVFDGHTIGIFDSKRNRFTSVVARNGFAPLKSFSWQSDYPDWERVCRRPGSQVLPDAQIAGRRARHIRCGDFRGEGWELWIDQETGVLLKLIGDFGGHDDFDLGSGGALTGGFEVTRLQLRPRFPAGTFSVSPPRGVVDPAAQLRETAARMPPFRAVVHGRFRRRTYTEEVSWQSPRHWRVATLAGSRGALDAPGGAGSFAVAVGARVWRFDARANSYDTLSAAAVGDVGPMWGLLPEGGFKFPTCRTVGLDRIAGRDAIRRHCRGYDDWVDSSTGLLLMRRDRRYGLRVRTIDYRPSFPPDTFRFVRPPGAVDAAKRERKRESDPYYKTRLRRGKPAPNWTAPQLGGGRFSVAGLRGKPALLLFLPDSCPAPDDVCEVFAPLQRTYERSKTKVAIVWVDWMGAKAKEARKVVRQNHLAFTAVVDKHDASAKAWKVQAWPFWLLLDSRGRVIEARFKPQTTAQLQQLLAKAHP